MVKSPQDFAAGLVLIAIASIAWISTLGLPFSQVGGVGSGMLPKSTALILGALGLLIVVGSLMSEGPPLERWSVREAAMVLGGVLAFALTIRGTPLPALGFNIPALGLAVAGPLAVLIAAQADRSTRLIEVVIFAVVLTALCIILFRFLLGLPIPVFPPLLGY
ncbi:MAG: tripartite tricarboxylate transporter TctB [Hyphomicrobium sp.]|nr:MAG: tripartite tricarboxylate transporter TctB [Hyphomicrobium sp.]